MVPAVAKRPGYPPAVADDDEPGNLPAALGVYAVPRNDVGAALAYHRARGISITADEVAVLLQLQDDPAELLALIAPRPPPTPRGRRDR